MIKETTTFISTPFQYTTISIIWIIPAEIGRGEIGGGGGGGRGGGRGGGEGGGGEGGGGRGGGEEAR